MTQYHVKGPDGKTYIINGPAGATNQQVIEQAQRLSREHDVAVRSQPLAKLDAAMGGILHGVTSGFDDELVGAINAIAPLDKLTNPDIKSVWDGSSFGDAYKNNRDIGRRQAAADAVASPIIRGTGNVAGAVAQTILGGRVLGAGAKVIGSALPAATNVATKVAAVAPKVLKGTLAKSVAGGAAQGALAGAGEGDTTASRLHSAELGGVAGGVLGGGVNLTVRGLAPVVGRYWNAIKGSDVTQQALQQVQRALARDGYDVSSPAGVQALNAELSRFAGKPVSLADVGAATRARAGVGLRTASDAQQQGIDTVLARTQGQGQRLSADIRANVAPRTDVHALDDALVQQRADTALPLRQKALNVDNPDIKVATASGGEATPRTLPVVIDDPVLQNLARTPLAQRSLAKAAASLENERATLTALGEDTTHLPDPIKPPVEGEPQQPLDFKTLDHLKRYLDKEVSSAYASPDSGVRAEAANLQQLRDGLRDRMRATNSSYGDYLDAYSDTSSMRDALAAGRGGPSPSGRGTFPGFDKTDPEVIAAEQAKRTPAEQELYRVGAARRLEDIVRDTKDNVRPANRILNDPNERAQVAATGVSPENAATLNNAVQHEKQFNLLQNEMGGSATDARLAARADADAGLAAKTPFNPSNPLSWAAFLARKITGTADLRQNARINEVALPRLLAQDPATIQKTIGELTAAGRNAEAETLRRAAAAKFGSRVAGTIIGAPVALPEGTN